MLEPARRRLMVSVRTSVSMNPGRRAVVVIDDDDVVIGRLISIISSSIRSVIVRFESLVNKSEINKRIPLLALTYTKEMNKDRPIRSEEIRVYTDGKERTRAVEVISKVKRKKET